MTAAAGAVGFGFLGAGYIAQRALGPAVHAAENAVLQVVGARDETRARALEPTGPTSGDYRVVVEHPDVDVVYIALPNDDHLPWALAALEAGKHVLCEKPLGLDPGEVRRMADAARTAGRVLVEATWYRWHPRALRTRELVRSGAVGEPRSSSTAWRFDGVAEGNYRLDPRRGGGAWYDIGCYGVSATHLLLGDELEVVDAHVRLGPTGVDLQTRARLRTPDGATGDVLASIDAPEHQDVTLHGSEGTLTWSAPQLSSWREPASLTIARHGAEPVVERFEPVDAYQLMVEQVCRVVRGEDAEPVVTTDESERVATTMAAVTAAADVTRAAP